MKWKLAACNPCVQLFLPGTKPARVEAAAAGAAAAAAAAGPGSRLLLTDPPLQLRLPPEAA